jgi:hypothetical protein
MRLGFRLKQVVLGTHLYTRGGGGGGGEGRGGRERGGGNMCKGQGIAFIGNNMICNLKIFITPSTHMC